MSKILLYTDQPIADIGFRHVLEPTKLFVLPPCSDVEKLIERAEADLPDLVVVDLTAEVTLAVLQRLRRATPAGIALWVDAIHTEFAYQVAQLGIRGVVRKSIAAEQQLGHLQTMVDGGLFFEQQLTTAILLARRETLTKRQAELVAFVSAGWKNKEIGGKLGITEGTVKVYFSHLFEKLGCKDRHELAIWGMRNLGNSPHTAAAHAPRQFMVPRPQAA